MFGDVSPDEFRFFFPKSFIDDSVKEEFKNFMTAMELPYSDLTDFINASVIGWTLGGLKDDHDITQSFDRGRTKSYKGSKPIEEGIPKDLEVMLKLKEACMNWFIMRRQLEEYLGWDRPVDKNFLPPVYLQMLDEEDRIILEVTYTYVRFVSISDISLSVQENGIVSKEFTIGLTYNKIEFKYYQNNIK